MFSLCIRMNSERDERYIELAMKLAARNCTPAEKAELRQILAEEPHRRAQLATLCGNASIARELLPLVSALDATEGELTTAERDSLRMEVTRVFGPPKSQGSGGAQSTNGSQGKRTRRNGKGKKRIIEAREVDPGAPKTESDKRPLNKYLVVFTIAVGLALIAWVAFLVFGRPLVIPRPTPEWSFAIVQPGSSLVPQPIADRSEKDIAPLKDYLAKEFSISVVPIFKDGSPEIKDWELTHTENTVQVKCFLEGGPVDRFRFLVARFGVHGWHGLNREFSKEFVVKNMDWTNSLEQIESFVKRQK
jgi:hypothetical protein